MKTRFKSLALLAALGIVTGCGGANNDQGVSFSLLEFNSVDEEGVCQPDVGSSGIIVPLTNGIAQENSGDFGIFSCLKFRNNMTTQGVRVERVFLDYFVPGASQQPPSTTSPISATLGPSGGTNGIGIQNNQQGGAGGAGGGAGGGGAGGGAGGAQVGTGAIFGPTNQPGSTLPPNFSDVVEVTSGFTPVPTEIREWLSLNRSQLPPRPFNMTIYVTGSGVTTSGDRLETNMLSYLAVVTEDNLIQPNAGVEEADDETVTVDEVEFEDDSEVEAETS